MNIIGALLGWFLWNLAELEIRRRQYANDNDPSTVFNAGQYAAEKKFVWVGSLVCCALILWIRAMQLNLAILEPVMGYKLAWNDLLLLAPGAAFEAIIFIIGQVERYFNKRSQ